MLKTTKGLTWPFLALAMATSVVFMAGLAALQAGCGSLTLPGQGTGAASASGAGLFNNAVFGASDPGCYRMFRFYWFSWAFVFATLIGLFICTALTLALHWSRAFWVGMLSVSILLMMIASEFFVGADNAFDSGSTWSSGSMHARWRTTEAGAIMSVVSLILLLLGIGTDWDRYGHGSHHRGYDDKVTGPTTATTTGVAPASNVRVVDQV